MIHKSSDAWITRMLVHFQNFSPHRHVGWRKGWMFVCAWGMRLSVLWIRQVSTRMTIIWSLVCSALHGRSYERFSRTHRLNSVHLLQMKRSHIRIRLLGLPPHSNLLSAPFAPFCARNAHKEPASWRRWCSCLTLFWSSWTTIEVAVGRFRHTTFFRGIYVPTSRFFFHASPVLAHNSFQSHCNHRFWGNRSLLGVNLIGHSNWFYLETHQPLLSRQFCCQSEWIETSPLPSLAIFSLSCLRGVEPDSDWPKRGRRTGCENACSDPIKARETDIVFSVSGAHRIWDCESEANTRQSNLGERKRKYGIVSSLDWFSRTVFLLHATSGLETVCLPTLVWRSVSDEPCFPAQLWFWRTSVWWGQEQLSEKYEYVPRGTEECETTRAFLSVRVLPHA